MSEKSTEFMSAIEMLKPYLKIDTDNMESIRGQQDIEHMAAVFRMVLYGIDKEKIRKLSDKDKDINAINMFITEELTQKYGENEKVQQQLEEANEMVMQITEKNEEIRRMFEVDVKAAIEREHTANMELIQQYKEGIKAKDIAFNMVKQQCSLLEEELSKKREEISSLKAQMEAVKSSPNEPEPQQYPHQGFWASLSAKKSSWQQKRQTEDCNHFIVELAKNNEFSNEQKEYLLSLLEEGVPLKVVKRISYPEISLKMMQTMKSYMYNKMV